MRFPEEHYRETKRRAEDRLFAIPGVFGVSLGPKIVAGRLTSTAAIQVHVRTKRSPHELDPGELVPAFIEDIATDVIEGAPPIEMTSTVRCRKGPITSIADVNGSVEITAAGHQLKAGQHVRVFGLSLSTDAAFAVTIRSADVFALPADVTLIQSTVAGFAFWSEVCSFDDGLCCCPTGAITDAKPGKPVVITSGSHGLVGGDRIKIAEITGMTQIRGKEFVVGSTSKDTFALSGIDGSAYTWGASESGRWEKLCMDRSGRIQKVRMGDPVVFTSAGHALHPGDRIHIVTTRDDLHIASSHNPEPYTVATIAGDTFTVAELTKRPAAAETAIIGCWIRILSDGSMYSRARGGIRLAMDKDEYISAKPFIVQSAQQGMSTGANSGTVTTYITYGTLGCLATENGTNKKVLISNYHVLWSLPDEDNVHHPDYSCCKSHRIGIRMRHAPGGSLAAPSTVDAAIAELTHPSDADPAIVDIGDVRGTATITLADILADTNDPTSWRGYRVRKRGITTLVTEGIVTGLDATFHDSNEATQVFTKDQITIQAMAGDGLGAMSLKGDSGSALVNDDNMVVGLIWGGDARGHGYASPIAEVEHLLNVKVLAASSASSGGGGGGTPVAESDSLVIIPPLPDLLASVVAEVSATSEGAQLVSLVLGHHQEVEHLVHHHRRVTVAWHRNGGPSILRELHQVVVRRDLPLPAQIDGLTVSRCVENFFDALQQSGTARLVADVERYRDDLAKLSGMSYVGMLQMLAGRAEAPHA